MTMQPYGRYWAVYDVDGTLVCLCVYKKGAAEVLRRLSLERRTTDEQSP